MGSTKKLNDLCELIVDCPHSTPVWTDRGVTVLRSHNIRNGRLNLSERSFTNETNYQIRSRRAEIQAGDLVITREAPMGEVCMIPVGLRCCLGQRMVLLRPNKNECDARYLLYALQSHSVQHEIRISEGTGSTVSNLRIPLLEKLPIPSPPISDQRAIASVLAMLDDKIDLNRQMNETLEALAQTLFKNWFVNTATTKLPKGWRKGPILELAKLISGGTPKTGRQDYWDGGILWASAKDVSQCRHTFLTATERTITEKGLTESATRMISPLCTVVVARGATTGRMVIFGREIAMNQTCYALSSTTETPFALYCILRHAIDNLVHAAHGSVFDTITTSTFARSNILLPPVSKLQEFEASVSSVFHRILANTEESHTLAELRDALLPKLLSGELHVPSKLKEPVA